MSTTAGPAERASSTKAGRRFWLWLCFWGGLAAGVRLLHVWLVGNRLGTAQIHDSAYYHDLALMMLGRQTVPGLASEVAFANVGYPHVLAWIYRISPSPALVLVLQALLGGVTTVLTGVAARDIFHRRQVGLWAAALFALYAPSIFYDGLLLIPSLSAFLAALLGWSLARAASRRSWRFALLSGAAIGLAALLRMSQLLLLPLVLVTLWRLYAGGDRRSVRWGLLLALVSGAAACIVPIIVHQRAESGAWVPVTSNGGMNYWIGNHRGANGRYEDAPFLGSPQGGDFQYTVVVERDRFLAEARRRSGQPGLSLAESSRFWWRETWKEMAAAPAQWLGVMLRKVWMTANSYELRTNASIDLIEEISPIVRWNPLRFGALLVLAGLGAVHLRGRRYVRARWMALALVAAPWLTCIVFFVSGEYRHPAAPAMAALAGFAVHRIRLAASPIAVRLLGPLPRAFALAGLAVAAFFPSSRVGPAKDRKMYAETLAMPTADGKPPTALRYTLARSLLHAHGNSSEDRLLSTEALLLVESNQAIQFRDREAAERLTEVARTLWEQDLESNPGLQAATTDRIRRNTVRRVAQLCRQPFTRQWDRVYSNLVLLGCHGWEEAKLLLERRAITEAQSFLDRAKAWAPHSVQVLAYYGQLEWLRGNDAMPYLLRSLNGRPRLALPALLAAEYALAKDDVASANHYAQEALAREPSNRAAQELALRVALGNKPLPARATQPAPQTPPSTSLLQVRVRALLREGRSGEAIAALQAAVREGPYDEGLRYTLGELMTEHASPEATIAFFAAEATRDEKPQTSHYFIAVALERKGDRDGAIAELGRALEIDPAHEMSQRLWGLLLERQGKPAPALEHLLEATRIHPEYRAALLDAARLADRLGQGELASSLRLRARTANPDTPRRFLYWARYLHQHGRGSAALAEIARGLKDAPDDQELLELRGTIRGAAPEAEP